MKALASVTGFLVLAVIAIVVFGRGAPVSSGQVRYDARVVNDPAVAKRRRAAKCFYNCPPPVGSVTASPQVISMPTGGLASVTLHWRWDQSSTQAVSEHGCLWVSRGDESEVHLVECQGPGRTYSTTVGWIGAGHYIFRVAPGNPKGPFAKPVAGLFQLAQTIVVGAPR